MNPNDLKDDSYSYDWLRLKDETLVSHLPTLFKDYLVTETGNQASLYVIKYDLDTHEQLASYEPLLIQSDKKTRTLNIVNNQNVKHVFSLAYLQKHAFKVNELNSEKQATCYADFLVAKPSSNTTTNHRNFLNSIMKQMERSSKFTIRYKERGQVQPQSFEKDYKKVFHQDAPNPTVAAHVTESTFIPKFVEQNQPIQYQEYQPQPQYHHQPLPYQQQAQVFDHPQHQQQQQQQVQQPIPQPQHQVYYHPQPLPVQPQPQPQFQQQPPQHQQQFQQVQPQHQPQPQPQPQPIHIQYSSQYQEPGNPRIFNNLNYNYHGPSLASVASDYIRNNQLRNMYSQLSLQSYAPYLQYLPLYREKRNDEKSQVYAKEDLDFDTEKLFKIRLSLGPIAIKEHDSLMESLECTLTLASPESPYYYSTTSHELKRPEPPVFNDRTTIDQIMAKSYFGPNHQNIMVQPQLQPQPQFQQPIPINTAVQQQDVQHKNEAKDHFIFLIDDKDNKNVQDPTKLAQNTLLSSADRTKQNLVVLIVCFFNAFFLFFL